MRKMRVLKASLYFKGISVDFDTEPMMTAIYDNKDGSIHHSEVLVRLKFDIWCGGKLKVIDGVQSLEVEAFNEKITAKIERLYRKHKQNKETVNNMPIFTQEPSNYTYQDFIQEIATDTYKHLTEGETK